MTDTTISTTEASTHLQLRIITQDGSETQFKLKYTTPLSKVFTAYCDRNSLQLKAVRFMFDGKRLNPEQTPRSLDMQDGDIIDVVSEQVGGM